MTTGAGHDRNRRPAFGAFGILGLVIVEVTTALLGSGMLGVSFAEVRDSFVLTNAAIALSFAVSGVLIAWQRPHNPVGWLLLATGVFQGGTAAAVPLLMAAPRLGWSEPLRRTLATLFEFSWPWSISVCLPLALLLFPDGTLPGRRWRIVVVTIAVEGVLFALEVAADPAGVPGGARAWFSVDPGALAVLTNIAEPLNGANYLACLAALALRYRRGDERLRRQLLWLALALLGMLLMFVVWEPSSTAGPVVFVLLVIPLVPAAITIAVLRHELLDIRLVFARAVTYVLLTGSVVGAYLGLVAVADALLRRGIHTGGSLAATLLIALGFNPVRVHLQRIIDRRLYGDRADPARAVARLGEHLVSETHTDGETGTEDALRAVREALRLPYAELRVNDVAQAADGSPGQVVETVALTYRGDHVGDLVVGVRTGQGRLSGADRVVLELLAVPLAVAVKASALAEAVQRSREQIVTGREEERRRLRRDLHDGLGPVLTGIALQLDAARNLLVRDPDRADTMLAGLRGHATEAIADVRRLVYELRPPSLDELGLVGALRRHVERLDGNGWTVTLVAPPQVCPLPAAVEVAAYRIAVEALTNTVRHARGSHVELRIAVNGSLEVTVSDDGVPDSTWEPGVGLTSVRERAAELGGTVDAGPSPGGGQVRARLPLGTTL